MKAPRRSAEEEEGNATPEGLLQGARWRASVALQGHVSDPASWPCPPPPCCRLLPSGLCSCRFVVTSAGAGHLGWAGCRLSLHASGTQFSPVACQQTLRGHHLCARRPLGPVKWHWSPTPIAQNHEGHETENLINCPQTLELGSGVPHQKLIGESKPGGSLWEPGGRGCKEPSSTPSPRQGAC